jgi:hypothetical protein
MAGADEKGEHTGIGRSWQGEDRHLTEGLEIRRAEEAEASIPGPSYLGRREMEQIKLQQRQEF